MSVCGSYTLKGSSNKAGRASSYGGREADGLEDNVRDGVASAPDLDPGREVNQVWFPRLHLLPEVLQRARVHEGNLHQTMGVCMRFHLDLGLNGV